jgi:hypothetical protein
VGRVVARGGAGDLVGRDLEKQKIDFNSHEILLQDAGTSSNVFYEVEVGASTTS